MAGVSTHFLGQAGEEAVMSALAAFGSRCNADRSYIFRFSPRKQTMTNLYEWCAEGIQPAIELLQDMPMADYPWWMERLEKDGFLSIPDVAALPPIAAPERAVLEMQSIKSLVAVPLFIGEAICGFVGLDYVTRQVADTDAELSKLLAVLTSTHPNAGRHRIVRRTGRILVVDDEPIVQSFTKLLFQYYGFEADVCADGESALEYCKEHPEGVDLVVLDLLMPGMTGDITFYRMLQYWPEVNVLIISGFPGQIDVEQMLEDGALGFIAKPFTMADIAAYLPEGETVPGGR